MYFLSCLVITLLILGDSSSLCAYLMLCMLTSPMMCARMCVCVSFKDKYHNRHWQLPTQKNPTLSFQNSIVLLQVSEC